MSILKDLCDFGKFLLVVSGFDKELLGEFLAKEKPPNDKKEILKGFIESINLNYDKNYYLEEIIIIVIFNSLYYYIVEIALVISLSPKRRKLLWHTQ